jgi:RHH-type proline utilization regulon transcriptional repressor/proline dehydrogenase/delta 1-pyrroline-5-carboxylate dehydrogenase
VLQFVPGMGETIGAAMVTHPETAFIAFTGSRAVGLTIIENAAVHQPGQRHIKKVIAELGGKNPMIIDSDADLDQAVPAIVYSAFGFAGQKCSALSRLIVHERIKDVVIERLVGAVNDLKVGDPTDMAVDVGPVIDADAHSRITGIVNGAYMWGDLAASRTDLPAKGYFVPPTIVTDVKPDSPLARDEIFGPVLSVFTATDIDHALALANDTEYALTAGLFSRMPSHIKRVANEVRAGNVYVNRQITGAVVGRQPFGGHGMSGVGTKAGGPDYLLHFMEPRTVTENTVRQGFAELT